MVVAIVHILKKERKGGKPHEDDLPAEEKADKKRTWFSQKNEHQERQKCFKEKKIKRKKVPFCIKAAFRGLFIKERNKEVNEC